MLRYLQPLGCVHGGEGLTDMRLLLLREIVINESRNCSFMVRGIQQHWQPHSSGKAFLGCLSCLSDTSFFLWWWRILAEKKKNRAWLGDSPAWILRKYIENLLLYKCHTTDVAVSPSLWKMNGTIGNAIIRLTFPNNRILPLSLEKRPLRTFVHLFEDSIQRLKSGDFGEKWSIYRVHRFFSASQNQLNIYTITFS